MTDHERDVVLAELAAGFAKSMVEAGWTNVEIAMMSAALTGAMLGHCPADRVKRVRRHLLKSIDLNEASTRRMAAAYARAGVAGVSTTTGQA